MSNAPQGVVFSLNESPSEKEGKSHSVDRVARNNGDSLNESPSEKEGK